LFSATADRHNGQSSNTWSSPQTQHSARRVSAGMVALMIATELLELELLELLDLLELLE
jgi:hypothetical protein